MEHEPDVPRGEPADPAPESAADENAASETAVAAQAAAETAALEHAVVENAAVETAVAEATTAEGTVGEITVEPGVPRPGTEAADPEPQPGPDGCPHRARLRDLTPGGRALYALGLLAVAAAGLVQIAALFVGGFLVSIGTEFAERALIEGVLFILGSMFGLIGVFALPGTWRRLHRPEAPILWLAAAGIALTTTALALLAGPAALPWAAAVAAPNLAVAALLAYLRTVLDPRDTCDTHPALPTRSRYLRHP